MQSLACVPHPARAESDMPFRNDPAALWPVTEASATHIWPRIFGSVAKLHQDRAIASRQCATDFTNTSSWQTEKNCKRKYRNLQGLPMNNLSHSHQVAGGRLRESGDFTPGRRSLNIFMERLHPRAPRICIALGGPHDNRSRKTNAAQIGSSIRSRRGVSLLDWAAGVH